MDETHTGDLAIAALAAGQHGVVSTGQLAAAGIGERAVAHRVANGRLVRLHRGVYQVGPLAAPRGREMAAVLASGGVLSHHTAAALWGLRPHQGLVHVTTTGEAPRSRPGLRIHRSFSLNAAVHDGLPLTTPARTLRDVASQIPQHEVDKATEQAQIFELTTRELIAAELDGGRGSSRLRAALLDEPTLTRSEAERRLKHLIRAARLPRPQTNVPLKSYVVDVLWRQHRLVVEVDGYAYHSSRAAFERDRRRDADLQASGYRVIRLTWRQLTREPHAVVALLATLLAA